jgi:hypothetical protein
MATSEASSTPQRPLPTHALRLTFSYGGGGLRLTESRRVEMMTPPVVTPVPKQGQSGYWLQVTDASGRVVYHRPLHNPIAVDTEAYSPDPKQSITRVPVGRREVSFTVLMPDLSEAATFALHGPTDPGLPTEPARELLRLDVDAIRKFAAQPPQPPVGQPGPGRPKGN